MNYTQEEHDKNMRRIKAGEVRPQDVIPNFPVPKRACGDCALCCKLLPVKSIAKVRNKWCDHARIGKAGTCCAIYDTRPIDCHLWSCMWLVKSDMPDGLKPNRSHVVFDIMEDDVIATDEYGNKKTIRVIQVWVDSGYPAAWRAPAVMAQMNEAGKRGLASLIRLGAMAIFVVPPSMAGEWQIMNPQVADDSDQEWEKTRLGLSHWGTGT
jgi:hypothetical protein